MFDVYDNHHRVDRLPSAQRRALAWTLLDIRERRPDAPPEEDLQRFVLPLAEMGLTLNQMLDLTRKVPSSWPFDHREIYFDFRLQRWMHILDAPTIDECLEDYVNHSPSQADALDYLERHVEKFFSRFRVKSGGIEAGGVKTAK